MAKLNWNVACGDWVHLNQIVQYLGHNVLTQGLTASDSPEFIGLTLSGLTQGSVLFAGSGGEITQNNSEFYWDNTNKQLGIGAIPPINETNRYAIYIRNSESGKLLDLIVDNRNTIEEAANQSRLRFATYGDAGGFIFAKCFSGHPTTPNVAFINQYENADLIIKTNNTERMKIKAGGDINIDGLTASRLVAIDADKDLVSSDLNNWVAGTANQIIVTDDEDGTITLSLDADLGSIAALGTAANKMIYTTDAHVWAEADITAAGRAILDDADAAAQATTLGLGTGHSPTFSGLTLTGKTSGSIPYFNASAILTEDNSCFFYDVTNNRILIGTNSMDNWTTDRVVVYHASAARLSVINASASGYAAMILYEGTTNKGGYILYASSHANANEVWLKNYFATGKIVFSAGGGTARHIEIAANGAVTIGSLNGVIVGTSGVLSAQTIGIADDNLLEVDGSPNSGEYTRFTANGLEGRDATEVKTDLGLVIGTNVQAHDAGLLSLAGLTYASTSFVKMTGANTFALDTNTYLTGNETITLTGDVSGSGTTAITTTIGANKVLDSHINWGTGATEVSAVDVPIADAGNIITGTEVETALQENRTAIDLNTTHSQIAGGNSVHVSTTENTQWDAAYTHSTNSSQAHSDYLINNGDDTTSGTITCAGLTATGTVQAEHLYSTDDAVIDNDLTLTRSDYTITSRGTDVLAIQRNTNDAYTALDLYTKKGDGGDSLFIELFAKGTPASITNRELFQLSYQSGNRQWILYSGAGGTGTVLPIKIYTQDHANQLVCTADGRVGINQATPATNFDVGGYIRSTLGLYLLEVANGSLISTSSHGAATVPIYIGNETIDTSPVSMAGAKDNVVDTIYGINDLMKIKVKDYNYKPEFGDSKKRYTGMIAEELEPIVPNAIKEGHNKEKKELKYVNKKELIPLMIKSIQDLKREVEVLKKLGI